MVLLPKLRQDKAEKENPRLIFSRNIHIKIFNKIILEQYMFCDQIPGPRARQGDDQEIQHPGDNYGN